MERQGCELLQLYFFLQIQLFIINFHACASVLKDIQWCGSYWNHYKNNKFEKKAIFQDFIYYTGQAIESTVKFWKFTVIIPKHFIRKAQFCSRFQLHPH